MLNDAGGGDSRYLDRHDLQCPSTAVMKQWQLITSSSQEGQFEYTCCGQAPTAAASATLAENISRPVAVSSEAQTDSVPDGDATWPIYLAAAGGGVLGGAVVMALVGK